MSTEVAKQLTNEEKKLENYKNNTPNQIGKTTWNFITLFALFCICQLVFMTIIGALYNGDEASLGDMVSFSYIATTLCLLPLIYKLVQLENIKATFKQMGFTNQPSRKHIFIFIGWYAAYMLAQLTLNHFEVLPKPIEMIEIFQSSEVMWASFFAIVVCAPFLEELIFRGFVFNAWQKSWLGVTGTVITTSIIFTFIHSQYDFASLLIILVLAIILGSARYVTGGVWLSIYLHMLNNLIGWFALLLWPVATS